jgi:hypothetical protein
MLWFEKWQNRTFYEFINSKSNKQERAMKIQSLVSLFIFSIIYILMLAIPNQSLSQVGAFTYPSNPNDVVETVFTDIGYLSTNPNLTPVISNEGYSHTAHIEINKDTGCIRGYAGYNLDTARTITRTKGLISTIAGSEDEPALVANVGGGMDYETNIKGPGGSFEGEVDQNFATVFIDVEGSFSQRPPAKPEACIVNRSKRS